MLALESGLKKDLSDSLILTRIGLDRDSSAEALTGILILFPVLFECLWVILEAVHSVSFLLNGCLILTYPGFACRFLPLALWLAKRCHVARETPLKIELTMMIHRTIKKVWMDHFDTSRRH